MAGLSYTGFEKKKNERKQERKTRKAVPFLVQNPIPPTPPSLLSACLSPSPNSHTTRKTTSLRSTSIFSQIQETEKLESQLELQRPHSLSLHCTEEREPSKFTQQAAGRVCLRECVSPGGSLSSVWGQAHYCCPGFYSRQNSVWQGLWWVPGLSHVVNVGAFLHGCPGWWVE